MDSGELTPLLDALGEQLARAGQHVHLVVVGGSALLALGLGARPTEDVDVVAFVHDNRMVSAEPFPLSLTESARRVAADFSLHPNWLNPGPTSLLDEASGLPEGFLARTVEREFGSGLTVSFASRIDQIALKLMAFADRRYPRDEFDLRRLDPTGNELAAAAIWVRSHFAPGPMHEQLRLALALFGGEDDGRGD